MSQQPLSQHRAIGSETVDITIKPEGGKVDRSLSIQAEHRIKNFLSDSENRAIALSDLEKTLRQMDVSEDHLVKIARIVVSFLQDSSSFDDSEARARIVLMLTNYGGSDFPTVVERNRLNRSQLLFRTIRPLIKEVDGLLLDYGTGEGHLGQLIHDKMNLFVNGVDVEDFRHPTITIPLSLVKNGKTPYLDNQADAAVVTDVLHHSEDDGLILDELTRVIRRKLIVLETVPTGGNDDEIQHNRDRILFNDFVYNRLIHGNTIPLPGRYRTADEWREQFEKRGWKSTHEDELETWQMVMRDARHLFVFER